jgi:RNA-directed DNA polymerase
MHVFDDMSCFHECGDGLSRELVLSYVEKQPHWSQRTHSSFSPAVSNKAAKKMSREMRSWKLHLCSDKALEDLVRMFNSAIRGWINYYGSYYKSALYPTFRRFDIFLVKWAERKYKRLRGA